MHADSNLHVPAAPLQLTADLLDGCIGKLHRFLGDETGHLFAANTCTSELALSVSLVVFDYADVTSLFRAS